MNINKVFDGEFILVSYDYVIIMFYEMGYGFYGMLLDVNYLMLVGIFVLWDYVEFFFIFEEDWVVYFDVIVNYVKYYEIGEFILEVLLEKVICLCIFNMGYDILEYMFVVLFDMEWYFIFVD